MGVIIAGRSGLATIGLSIAGLGGGALLLALPRPKPRRGPVGRRRGFAAVFWRVTSLGLALSLGSLGFGVIVSFAALLYAHRGWSNPALMLTVFGGSFILCRLLFARRIGMHGGLRISRICFVVETAGSFSSARPRRRGRCWQAPHSQPPGSRSSFQPSGSWP